MAVTTNSPALIYCLEKQGVPFYVGRTRDLESRLKAHRFKHGEVECIVLHECDYVKDSTFWENHYIWLFKSYGFEMINILKGSEKNSDIGHLRWLNRIKYKKDLKAWLEDKTHNAVEYPKKERIPTNYKITREMTNANNTPAIIIGALTEKQPSPQRFRIAVQARTDFMSYKDVIVRFPAGKEVKINRKDIERMFGVEVSIADLPFGYPNCFIVPVKDKQVN